MSSRVLATGLLIYLERQSRYGTNLQYKLYTDLIVSLDFGSRVSQTSSSATACHAQYFVEENCIYGHLHTSIHVPRERHKNKVMQNRNYFISEKNNYVAGTETL